MKKQNILFVTGLHGDEKIPVETLAKLNIPQIIANPQALALGKRYIEMDMNKAFNTLGNTLEEQRARTVLHIIQQTKPQKIIDLHTTSAETDPFVIIVDLKLVPFAKTLGLKHIVYMKHNIKRGHALINHYPGVSVEAGMHHDLRTADTIESIVHNAYQGHEHPATIYEVYETIIEPGRYKNFEPYDNDFIPILAGEKAYDFYGLKARVINP